MEPCSLRVKEINDWILTTDGGLISSIGAVFLTIANFVQINAHLVSGAQPLSRGTAEGRGGAVLLVTHISTVILTITQPACWNTHLVGTLEIAGPAGDSWTLVVLIRSILTVWMAVTLPFVWYAQTICLALELVVMAKAWTSSGCGYQMKSVKMNIAKHN